jgi:hypothetical protein
MCSRICGFPSNYMLVVTAVKVDFQNWYVYVYVYVYVCVCVCVCVGGDL